MSGNFYGDRPALIFVLPTLTEYKLNLILLLTEAVSVCSGAVPEGQSSGPPPEHAGGPYGGDVEGGGLEHLVHFDSLANVLF